MSDPNEAIWVLAAGVYELAAATFYLSMAVCTLAVVGLIGYWVALRKARADHE